MGVEILLDEICYVCKSFRRTCHQTALNSLATVTCNSMARGRNQRSNLNGSPYIHSVSRVPIYYRLDKISLDGKHRENQSERAKMVLLCMVFRVMLLLLVAVEYR